MHIIVYFRVILRVFGFADNLSKERQYKGYCLIPNERAILGNALFLSAEIQFINLQYLMF